MKKTCKIDGCEGRSRVRGLCNKHYKRWRKYGDPHHVEGPNRVRPKCSVEGCDNLNHARGLCSKHAYKQRKFGTPFGGYEKNTVPHCRLCLRKKIEGHGLCQLHYHRWWRYGDPWFDGRNYPECSIEGCFKPRKSAKGWCLNHYTRWKDHGHPLGGQAVHMGVDLPMEPVDRLLRGLGGFAAVMDHLGPEFAPETAGRDRVEKYLDRARKDRGGWIDLGLADDFAVKVLGTHPALIWGEDYWTCEEIAEREEAVAA